MDHLSDAPRPDGRAAAGHVAVIDDFAAYAASLAAALTRSGVAGVRRFDSHDAALGNGKALDAVDVVFVDVYRHAAERAGDPHLSGVGALDVAGLVGRLADPPRVIVYSSWAQRPEVRLLVGELSGVEALYDSGVLLDHVGDALSGDHRHAAPPADDGVRERAGVGPDASIVEAIATARTLGAEDGEPYGDVWRFICDLDLGQDSRRAAGVPEAVRRAIGRRLVPLLDLPADANYLDAVRVIQRVAHLGPR